MAGKRLSMAADNVAPQAMAGLAAEDKVSVMVVILVFSALSALDGLQQDGIEDK
jgi:hypothetical protein